MPSKQIKTIKELAPGDSFTLGKSKVEVINNFPKDSRVSVVELKFLKTGVSEIRTFLSHFPVTIQEK
jgi:hypothetical protein